MSSTNHTANYNLPQFVGTDKPAWLGDINPAMNTIDTRMKANADGVAGILDMFNLDHFSSKNANQLVTVAGIVPDGGVRVAQNAEGSIFKFYRYVSFYNNSDSNLSIPLTAVPGLSGYYGLKTIQLNRAPSEAYTINCCGTAVFKNGDGTITDVRGANLYVGTDGWIYILTNTSNNYALQGRQTITFWYYPCVYFNGSFGDN